MEEIKQIQLETLLADNGICTEEGLHHIKTLPFLSIVICQEGSYSVSLGGKKTLVIPDGCAFIAPSGILQDIVHHLSKNGIMKMCWVFLDVRLNGIYSLDDLFTFPMQLNLEQTREFLPLIFALIEKQPGLLALCRRNQIGFSIVEKLLAFAVPKENSKNVLMPAIRKIRKDYAEPLRVEELASLCSLSPCQFLRRFKEETGETPYTYLINYRLAAAQALLQNTDNSMNEIAESCGFYDQFYFSRRFRSRYGMSPSQYRKSFKPQL